MMTAVPTILTHYISFFFFFFFFHMIFYTIVCLHGALPCLVHASQRPHMHIHEVYLKTGGKTAGKHNIQVLYCMYGKCVW